MKWFAVTLRPYEEDLSNDALDGLCADLMEHGALGTTITCAAEITCYLQGDQSNREAFLQQVESLKCCVTGIAELSEDNWTGACPDLWEPIRAGSLEVIPVESADDPRPVSPDAVKIIPGLGFGTGHHATTRMVLTELTKCTKPTPQAPYSILDLGTGSGILAIAAAKLFGSTIEAIDIDPGAIENARDNVILNRVENLVSLSTKPLSMVQGPFNLILANVYGEVLVQLAPEISRVAGAQATVIMSGITEIVWDQVFEAYCSRLDWRVQSEVSDSGWVCAVLNR